MTFGIEKVDLREIHFTRELLSRLPAATARRYSALPVYEHGDSLVVVLPDPSRLDAIDELHAITGKHLDIKAADPDQIDAFIEMHYGADDR